MFICNIALTFWKLCFHITLSFNLHCNPVIWVDFYLSLKAEAQKGNIPVAIQLVSSTTRKRYHHG